MNNDALEKYKAYILSIQRSLAYYNILYPFFEYLEKHNLTFENLNKDIMTAYLEIKQYSASSVNQLIKAGRDYCKFAKIDNKLFFEYKLLKTERKIPDYLSEKDLEQAIAYLITYHSNAITSIKAETLFKFLFYTGIRKAELLGLKRADIDLEECTAKVFGKGRKERIVYFPTKVKKLLEEYFTNENEEENAFNLERGNLEYLVRAINKHIEKKLTPHLFRHSGAREMLRKGIPLAVVSKILGHASVSTTMIYADENEEGRRNIYREKMK